MNREIKKIVGVIFIILGLGIIITVLSRKIETNNKQKELQITLQESLKDNSSIQNKDNINAIKEYRAIALIEIPSINLSQGIVEGVSDDVLKYYLGHFETSVMPGEKGNFAVAGHRISDYSEAFINLYKVEIGDKVNIKTNEKEYVYEVIERYIVSPDRVDVLENTEDATMTLITCTVGVKERLVIKGRLVEAIN